MKKIDLSIVIPVYNLEKYIEQCVKSIFPIDNAFIEVLLVNDGSTDNSGAVCARLQQEYPEVKLIQKTNGGAADTRNTGMKAAKGEYIMFIDGDDFLAPKAVNIILDNLQNKPQILTFDYFEYYGEGDERKFCHINAERMADSQGNISKDVFAKICPLPMPWLYVVSREYIEQYDIYMHPGLLDEDEEWTARLFALVSRVEILHEYLYFYRRNRENSLTFKRKVSNTLADVEIINILQDEMKLECYSSNGKYVLENKCRQMLNKILDDLPQLEKNDKRTVCEKIKGYRVLLRMGTTLDKMHFYLDGIIGRKNVAKMAGLLTKVKKMGE